MSNEYQYPAQEWQSSTPTNAQREARKEATAEAGQKALAECKAMLEDIPEEPVPDVTPCEHDYQPSTYFFGTVQCSKCEDIVEGPHKPPGDNEAPIECYENLAP